MAASEELAIVVRMRDFATRGFAALGKTVAGFAKGAAHHLFSLKGALVGFGAGWAGIKLIEKAQAIESISLAFDNLAKNVGGADAVLAALRQGTRNTVSDFKLMETANKAILLGVGETAQEFQTLSTLARRLGRAVGRDTVDAFNDLAIGIGRQSRLILDNLGLIVKVEDANKRYAAILGKTADELTDTEKRTAFMSATLEAARKRVADLGEDTWTLGDAWGRLRAVLSNTAGDIIRALIPSLTDVMVSIERFATEARPKILNTLADIVEGAGTFAVDVAGAIDDVARAFTTLGVRAAIAQKTLGFWAAIVKGAVGKGIDAELKKWNIELDHLLKELEDLESSSATTGIGKSIQSGAEAAAKKLRELAGAAREASEKEKDLSAATSEFIGPIQEIYGPIDLWADGLAKLKERLEKGKDALRGFTERAKEMFKAFDQRAAKRALDEYIEGIQKAATAAQEEKERVNAAKGAAVAFAQLRKESQAWGEATKGTIFDVTNMLGTRLTDGLLEVAENFKDAGRAAEEMAKQILRDFGRIITQMFIMKGLQAALGGIGGFFFPLGEGGMVPGSLRPAVISGHAAYGRKITHRGYYELAELGQPEVVLPMKGGAVRAEIRGGSEQLASTGAVEVNLNFQYSPSFVTSAEETALLRRNAKFIASSVAREVQRSLELQEAWRR